MGQPVDLKTDHHRQGAAREGEERHGGDKKTYIRNLQRLRKMTPGLGFHGALLSAKNFREGNPFARISRRGETHSYFFAYRSLNCSIVG